MRTLFISNIVPWPLNAGNRIRTYHLLRGVARASRVTLVCFAYDDEDAAHVSALHPLVDETIVIPRKTCRYWIDIQLPRPLLLMKNIVAWGHPTRPAILAGWESSEAQRVASALGAREFDLVWGERLGSLQFLPHFPRSRQILDLDDLEHRKLGYRLRYGSFDRRMPIEVLEFFKLRRFERGLGRRDYELVVCSELDRRALSSAGRVWVVPNGVELQPAPPAPHPPSSEPVLLFVGEMSYVANVDAVRFFVRDVLPRIRRRVHGTRCVIAGRAPDASVKALHDGEIVTVTGTVPSLQPYLEKAALIVVPIRFGGGTRIKILEAMAHGCPVVSTRVGAEGIEAEAGRDLLIADDPEAFADACVRVLRDPELRARLTTAASRLVEERYQWATIEHQVEGIVRSGGAGA